MQGRLVDSLAVKIALLNLIDRNPGEPRGTLDRDNIEKNERTNTLLPLDSEISVTQQLAFISAYSNDALHVTAICVEEVSEDTIIIRFAANTGSHDDLKRGLRDVARILESEARGVNRSGNGLALLGAVISLNRKRILCRLRSRHASSRKARGKPSLLSRLQEALALLPKSELSPSTINDLSRYITEMQGHFDQLEGMGRGDALSPYSNSCLLALVNNMNALGQFKPILHRIPDKLGRWETSMTKALMHGVQKSGHYVDACNELLRAARRYTIFSNIEVEFVNLQSSTAAVSNPDAALEGVSKGLIHRISKRTGQCAGNIKGCVKRKLMEKSRIHAEVQLVIFYETHSRPHRPRVICSSKSACYLCHLLLATQRKYLVPSTHGRLYTAWKWPEQGLGHLLPEFTNHIELKLQESVNRKTMSRSDPLESTVHLLPAITPSNQSDITVISQASVQTRARPARRINTTSQDFTSSAPTASVRVDTPSDDKSPNAGRGTEAAKVQPHENRGAIKNICHSPEDQRDDISRTVHLVRGAVATHSFTNDNRTLRVLTPKLHIHWECDISTFEDNVSTAPQPKTEFRLQLEWVNTEASKQSGEHALELVGGWEDTPIPDSILFTANGLLLKRGSTLVRLRTIPT
ncbi:hypothetical protein LOZ58_001578 [Ophidiomyces ophidiicola]|nr:hypothetical protein LOZ58_001578 [Ophidiomyces ophidiicola]